MSQINLDSVLSNLQKSLAFTKEVEVMGLKLKLRLLSLTEEQKANSDPELEELDGASFMNRMRKNVLCYSIIKIDEQEFDPIVEYQDKEGNVIKKERSIVLREILDGLPADIVEALFDIYVDLKEESEQKIKDNLNYKWFKDPVTREKEMRERIKKLSEAEHEKNESIKFKEVPKQEEDDNIEKNPE